MGGTTRSVTAAVNFLAHLYLADPIPESRVGNMMGDFVKGRAPLLALPPAVRVGVRLHRAVDRLTDDHPIVQRAAARMVPHAGRYAGLVVDVAMDHFLARDWAAWHPQSLALFAAQCHADLRAGRELMSPLMQRVVQRLEDERWLTDIADFAGFERALERLSRRLKRWPHPLADAGRFVLEHHEEYAAYFEEFFPDLIDAAAEAKAALWAEEEG